MLVFFRRSANKAVSSAISTHWQRRFFGGASPFFKFSFFKSSNLQPSLPPLLPNVPNSQFGLADRNDPLSYLREDPQMLNRYLAHETRYVDRYLKSNKREIQRISSKLESFYLRDSNVQGIVPEHIGSYQYWTIETSSGSAYCRLPASSSWYPVKPFLNPEDFKSHEIKKLSISPSHTHFAYILESIGEEHGKLYLKSFSDLKSVLSFSMDRIFNVVFLTDTCIAYTILNEQLRPDKVYLATIFDFTISSTTCIYTCNEGFLDISMTKDKRYLTINSNTLNSSEVLLLDATQPWNPLILVQRRKDSVQYYVDHHENCFYILTNIGENRNFKLVTARRESLSVDNWQDLYVPEKDKKIEDIDLFKNHLVIYLRHQAQCCIEILHLQTGLKSLVPLGLGVSPLPASNTDFQAKSVRMNLRHPYSFDETVELQFDTLRFVSLRSPSISNDVFCKSDFTIERIWVPSRDNISKIPVTLLRKKDIRLNGMHPLLVQVYGAYGLSLDPILKESNLLLLNDGWIIAYAHVRGGSELGFNWHEDGKMNKKMNSILDLLDVCQFLISHRYTCNSKLAGSAVSAGALTLASAALHQPELFQGIVLKSPFLDLISTMTDPTLPLTEQEYLEWGNPSSDSHLFDYMTKYSPYDVLLRTTKTSLPSLFVAASKNDQRTPIWQCAKFMAMYRHKATAFSIFQCQEEGGHFLRNKSTEALEILFLNTCVK